MERIDKLKQYLLANPHDSFLNHALALEYLKSGDTSAARTVFEGLLGRDPGYVGSYYHLGRLLESTGNIAEAIDWYKKGILVAGEAGDHHAKNELQAALDDLD